MISIVSNVRSALTPQVEQMVRNGFERNTGRIFDIESFIDSWTKLLQMDMGAIWIIQHGEEVVGATGAIIHKDPDEGIIVVAQAFLILGESKDAITASRLLVAIETFAAMRKASRVIAAVCYDPQGGKQAQFLASARLCALRNTVFQEPDMGTEALIALAAVSVAASLAGTGVAVAGAQQQAKAAEDTAKFNAKVAENDALAAQQQATAEAEQVRRKNRLIAGGQRAAYGKAGVDLSSLNDVYTDTGTQGELEALSVLYAGERSASYNQSRAAASRFEGGNARAAGRYAVAGSLIGGLASTAGTISSNPSFRRTRTTRYGQS